MKLRDARPTGAQVIEIAADSPAARAEIETDDIITEVAAKPVANAAACAAALAAPGAKPGKGVVLNIERRGKKTYVVLNPQK
jgi:S1-C subfamily serine protease